LEEHITSKQLSKDAAKTPDVDLVVVPASKDDLRSAVRPRLDIAAQMVMDKARAAEVNDLDLASGVRLDKNIFGLEIAMDEFEVMDEAERVEDLLRDFLEPWNVEVQLLFDLSVVLRILVQIVPEQLSNDEQVLFVVEVINQLE
jgi:hypothetical protein